MYNNQNLELFLMNYFNKKITEITDEEINNLETLSLDGIDISGIYEKIDFEFVISLFPNLKKIVINNYVFSDEDVESINKSSARKFVFYNCDFTKIKKYDILKTADELYFERCNFEKNDVLYNEFSNIKVLSVINPSNEEEIDIEKISSTTIVKMYLENCIISNQKSINKFENLEYLDIINTSIEKMFIEGLLECGKLRELHVLEKYLNDEEKNKLVQKNIIIKYDNNEELFEREEI